jgi:hypothetical protein
MDQSGGAWRRSALAVSITSLFSAVAFHLVWAVSVHRHSPDWITFSLALVFAVTAVGWFFRWRKAMADSRGERNELGELLQWCHVTKCLAWPTVEASLDSHQVLRRVGREVGVLRHVLAQ